MKASENGVEFVAAQEGWRANAYHLPGEAHWTIGYGHYGADVHQGMVITHARGLELLRQDLAAAEHAVDALGLKLSQGKFDALVSIVFNCGAGILGASSSLGRALRAPGMRDVPAAMMLYVHGSTGAVLLGLVARRKAEVAMWTRGINAGAASWLTRTELERCRHLDRLRKVANPNSSQRAEIAHLVSVLTDERQAIWRAAQPAPKGDGHGWDFRQRSKRYQSLLSRTT